MSVFSSESLLCVMNTIISNLILATLLCYEADATFYVLFSFLRSSLLLLYTGKCKEPTLLRLTDLGVSLFFWRKVKKGQTFYHKIKGRYQGQSIVKGRLAVF